MTKALEVFSRLVGRDLRMAFPQEFYQNHPLENAQQGCCLGCGEPMNYDEMHPPGRTPRHMHDHCYEEIVRRGPKRFCLTCGGPLSQEQIYAQMSNPKELTHAFHPGLCEEYHALLAGIVLGVVPHQVSMLPQHAGNRMLPFSRFSEPHGILQKAIDVEPVKPGKQLKFLKFLK